MKVSFEVEGFEDARRKMQVLPDALQARAWGDGMASAGRGMMRRARFTFRSRHVNPRLPILRGKLRPRTWEVFRVRRISWRWGGVRVKASAALVIVTSPMAWWIEGGTKERFTRSGAARGRIEPRPFLAPELKKRALVMGEFERGVTRSVRRVYRQIAAGRVTRVVGRALRGI